MDMVGHDDPDVDSRTHAMLVGDHLKGAFARIFGQLTDERAERNEVGSTALLPMREASHLVLDEPFADPV